MEQTLSNDSAATTTHKGIPTLQTPSSYKQSQTNETQWTQRNSGQSQRKSPPMSASRRNDEISSELHRGAPTDDTRLKNDSIKTPGQIELAKQRNQYYNEAFGLREPYHTSRNRVNHDSIIVVDMKTNLQVEAPHQTLSDMTFHFAQIFQRPESSMMVVLDDSAFLRFGTTAEPAYLVTVSALSHMIAPTMNLRHTALIQSAIREILDIPQGRGVIKFESMPEENFATNGSTIRDEIEQMERTSHEENSLIRTISRTMTRRGRPNATKSTLRTVPATPPRSTEIQRTSAEFDLPKNVVMDGPASTVDGAKKVKRYRSIVKLFSN
ncbi:hypothetical protein D8B26_005527 [Coccidioides posadasii str. Silveira]|uniref:L-dopachrome isomerase n=3 Tax=Coccidioides posadasii TaxID=199306 RepID=E9D3R5_COCPS|nr:Macrophage migration inhibitory factor family protein [Coccidioides posadasii C735 delta SOWgp]EER26912.1 Macrophage migration inhibitory factor family protein [Coccidioides posadasii C735 delta SOWgp]EFW18708.1 conserved hypothetical protein [Coccidioides posadasii str. Silveira]KMM72345.1 MIF domain-containing protein [Coccidioides posadasii RMSCC 3488]QVM10875.1 hypothetical protein D8B26_005527 [Coccidioides posadasii str. Silveira]|eukprot:XP_003069057.1 Macrophage migration inhibitory factor family protein [Coccidioides posadasii C735 delta SOWgp]